MWFKNNEKPYASIIPCLNERGKNFLCHIFQASSPKIFCKKTKQNKDMNLGFILLKFVLFHLTSLQHTQKNLLEKILMLTVSPSKRIHLLSPAPLLPM